MTNTKCRGGVEVTLCTIRNLGHTWPGNDYGLKACDRPNALVCRAWKKLVNSSRVLIDSIVNRLKEPSEIEIAPGIIG